MAAQHAEAEQEQAHQVEAVQPLPGDDDATWSQHPDLAAYRDAGCATIADALEWQAAAWTPPRVRGWLAIGVDCARACEYRDAGVRTAAALTYGDPARGAALAEALRT